MIGASAGGLDAISTILRGLPEDLALTLVVVQHRSRDSHVLSDLLQNVCALPVSEAFDKEPVEPGRVFLAAADYHLLVEPGHFALSLEAPEAYSRPSIDLAFESAAHSYGPRALGVVLTGANQDGSRGLQRIVARGGQAVVQDPATAEVDVMPASAIAAVPKARVIPLAGIAQYLRSLPGARKRSAQRTQ